MQDGWRIRYKMSSEQENPEDSDVSMYNICEIQAKCEVLSYCQWYLITWIIIIYPKFMEHLLMCTCM